MRNYKKEIANLIIFIVNSKDSEKTEECIRDLGTLRSIQYLVNELSDSDVKIRLKLIIDKQDQIFSKIVEESLNK
jgi:hypothetical protein